MRKPKLLKESMMSEIDLLAQESDDVKTFLSKLKPFLQKFAADDKAYADPKVLKGIVAMYFDPKGVKVAMDESVSKLTEMIRAEIKKVLKEDMSNDDFAAYKQAFERLGTAVADKLGPFKVKMSRGERTYSDSPWQTFNFERTISGGVGQWLQLYAYDDAGYDSIYSVSAGAYPVPNTFKEKIVDKLKTLFKGEPVTNNYSFTGDGRPVTVHTGIGLFEDSKEAIADIMKVANKVFTNTNNIAYGHRESVVKEDSRQATSTEFQKASKFAASKGMKLSSIGVDKKTGKVKIQASKSETSPEEEFELDEAAPIGPGKFKMATDGEAIDLFTGEDYLNGNKWHDYAGLVKQYPVFKKLNKAFVEKLIEKLPEIRSHALNKLENTLVKQFAKVGVTITPTEGDDTSVSFTVTNTGMKESAIAEAVPTLRKLKVGAIVTPKIGPHKGQKHEIIHDFGNGKYNIKPVGLKGAQIKYKLGAAGATEDQFDVVQESISKKRGSLNEFVDPVTILTTILLGATTAVAGLYSGMFAAATGRIIAADVKSWWDRHKKDAQLRKIITRLKTDPEVMKYVSNKNARGIVNVIKSKLQPEELQYIGSLTRGAFNTANENINEHVKLSRESIKKPSKR